MQIGEIDFFTPSGALSQKNRMLPRFPLTLQPGLVEMSPREVQEWRDPDVCAEIVDIGT